MLLHANYTTRIVLCFVGCAVLCDFVSIVDKEIIRSKLLHLEVFSDLLILFFGIP